MFLILHWRRHILGQERQSKTEGGNVWGLVQSLPPCFHNAMWLQVATNSRTRLLRAGWQADWTSLNRWPERDIELLSGRRRGTTQGQRAPSRAVADHAAHQRTDGAWPGETATHRRRTSNRRSTNERANDEWWRDTSQTPQPTIKVNCRPTDSRQL